MRLLATALILLAAGAAVIVGAGSLLARGYLMGQADQQLRGYTGQLSSHPLVATPILRVAPGAGALGTALGIEVRGSAGQLVLRQGGDAQAGQAIPAVPAKAAARAGELATIAASGGSSWRVIAEPIHYQVRRIPFGYDAEDFAVVITSQARPGEAGTLVAGLELRSIGQATGGLAVTGLAVSGVVAVLVTGLGAVTLHAILRPVSRARETLAAAAAGELSRRMPQRHASSDAGRLASSLNAMLTQIERAFGTRARTEAAARGSTGRMGQLLADTGHQMRRPLSVIHGLARSSRRDGQLGAGERDRALSRIADEAARLETLVDDLLTRHDPEHH